MQDKSRLNVHFIREAELYDAGTYRVALWTYTGSDLKEFNLTVYAVDDPMCKGVHLNMHECVTGISARKLAREKRDKKKTVDFG